MASIRRTASLVGWSRISFKACIADSQPESWPAQSCKGPAALQISVFKMNVSALAMILHRVSPTPIGLMLGHLPRAMSLPARSAEVHVESTCSVHGRFATDAIALHRLFDDSPKDEQSVFHAAVSRSRPEDPPAPSICNTVS